MRKGGALEGTGKELTRSCKSAGRLCDISSTLLDTKWINYRGMEIN